MVGMPGSPPTTRRQKIAAVVGATLIFGFIAYVLLRNLVFR
jgi:hypothetical protein